MGWPRFAMIPEQEFRRLKAPAQIELVEAAVEAFPEVGPGYGKNTSYRWHQVKEARARYWEARQPRSGAQARPSTSPGILPASEVNEWLRTLPEFVIPPGG